ncbi:MAG: putative signal transducing protein [Planctomycetota bacterium]|jgi:hypothetical protein
MMMMMTEQPDDLVTILTPATEFEAHTLAAVLKEAGIESRVFGTTWSGTSMVDGKIGVPLQVRRADAERAKAALEQNVEDSVDLDWDEVDVGEREDDLPLTGPGSMPLLARISLAAAILLVLAGLLGWLKGMV